MNSYVQVLEEAIKQYNGMLVLDRIKSDPASALELNQQNIIATLLFTDVRSFSQITRNISPDIIVSELNNFLSLMSEIIIRNNGFIDSFIGDAIFAIFGISSDRHAEDACSAALECISSLKIFNKRPESKFPFEIGIGINSGIVILGNIGSKYKLKFTAIGDMVNLASRMESLTRQYKCNIILTESTRKLLTSKYNVRELDKISVEGLKANLAIFTLVE
jgi:adenylate cyclase